jgi:phosphopantothenoylcysteine decarboxylase/phosphopantothenate--cysteine ligase
LLAGVKLLLTAGPTREALDPVRYISNHSSGKMGYAIARAAREAGAEVTLVSGPVALATPTGVTRIDVESAEQMHQAVMSRVGECDLFIGCAAVADYRPEQVASQKIKKTGDNDQMVLTLVKNPDIIADVGARSDKPFTVGFAAETVDVEQYALDKLQRKRLDMIAANDVSRAGQGFNADDNALTVFWQGGQAALPLADKLTLARHLVALIARHYRP